MNKPPYELYLDLYPSYVNKVHPKLVKEGSLQSAVILLSSIVGVAIICLFSSCDRITVPASAESIYSDEKIATAIYKAENSKKYPYGIKSIDTKGNKEYARKICLNTIRNNRKRFANQTQYKDFISFLGSRFCPTNIPSEYHLNKNWVRNVYYFLEKS